MFWLECGRSDCALKARGVTSRAGCIPNPLTAVTLLAGLGTGSLFCLRQKEHHVQSMYYLIKYSCCRDGKEITLEARDKNYTIHYCWQHIAQALVMGSHNRLNCCAPMSSLEGLFSSLTRFIIGKYFPIFSLNPSFLNLIPLLLIMPSIQLQIISLPP